MHDKCHVYNVAMFGLSSVDRLSVALCTMARDISYWVVSMYQFLLCPDTPCCARIRPDSVSIEHVSVRRMSGAVSDSLYVTNLS